MFEREITLNQFLLGYFDRLTADLTAEQLTAAPAAGGHSPLWILGHLAISTDFGRMTLGQELKCPKRWMVTFGPGSSDQIDDPSRFDKDELIETIRTGYPEICAAGREADPQQMDQPHSLELLQGTPIRTVGDLFAHLLTTHMSAHLGQLSYWRRLQGQAPLF